MSGEMKRDELQVRRQRVLLAQVLTPEIEKDLEGEEPLEECRRLVRTARGYPVGEIVQRREKPDPGTFLGQGKAEEMRDLAKERDAELIIVDADLRPNQQRSLEEITGLPVVDRTELILDIFASNARTPEARLQVGVAQDEYALPRLKRLWTHLHRERNAIGMRGGMGEKQIEIDRRLLRKKIQVRQKELKEILDRKIRTIRSRSEEFTVSLVGYTNAGKSTLLQALTGAETYIADKLFATLDTQTRIWKLSRGRKLLLSDTVGFIRRLPHHLIESFKATLAEASHADLLLHVVDSSAQDAQAQIRAVEEVLTAIGCADKPTLLVLNKSDQAKNQIDLQMLLNRTKEREHILVSAIEGTQIDQLRALVEKHYDSRALTRDLKLSFSEGRLLAFLEAETEILSRETLEEGFAVTIRFMPPLLGKLKQIAPEREWGEGTNP